MALVRLLRKILNIFISEDIFYNLKIGSYSLFSVTFSISKLWTSHTVYMSLLCLFIYLICKQCHTLVL